MSSFANTMLMGPNQAYIDSLLSTSVFYYDPFYSGSWSGTPVNNTPIGTFNDRYGRATWQLTQASGTSQPLYQTNSGKPYLLYDGVDDVLLTGTINSSSYFGQQVTLIMMANDTSASGTNLNAIKYIGATAGTRLIGVGFNTLVPNWISGGSLNAVSTYGSFKAFGGTKVTGTSTKKVYTNGILEGSANAVDITHATESMFVGAFRNTVTYAAFPGWIGEVVAWNTALSNYQINLISKYFLQRRGIGS